MKARAVFVASFWWLTVEHAQAHARSRPAPFAIAGWWWQLGPAVPGHRVLVAGPGLPTSPSSLALPSGPLSRLAAVWSTKAPKASMVAPSSAALALAG